MQPRNEQIVVAGRVMGSETGRPIMKVSQPNRQSHEKDCSGQGCVLIKSIPREEKK
jgi:hypothetical protein